MNVFLSWSGDNSKKISELFRDWLPKVIQAITPYFSPHDIEKGKRWSDDLSGNLDKSQFGLIFLTRDNLNAPWILFEAGALSKNLGISKVCPILFDLKPTDLSGPLAQFQASRFEKAEILKVLESVNSSMPNSLSDKTLHSVFEKWWPELEENILKIVKNNETASEIRSERDLLEEILRLARKNAYCTFERDHLPFKILKKTTCVI